MKLQDCKPTRDRPDVCHMTPFIRSDPHGPVELWSESDSSKCHVMTPYCSSNLDLSLFLSPASESKLKTHNLVNKRLSLCHNSPGVETPMHSPWGLTRKELLSGAHNSLRSSLTCLSQAARTEPPPWRQNRDPEETIGSSEQLLNRSPVQSGKGP